MIDLGISAFGNSIAKVWCFYTLRSLPDLLFLARWHLKVELQVLYRLRCFDFER